MVGIDPRGLDQRSDIVRDVQLSDPGRAHHPPREGRPMPAPPEEESVVTYSLKHRNGYDHWGRVTRGDC
jgi:hypothetical protein